ncbi:MAG: HIT domain-containing protein [Bacilli bacterium]|nr:HIT domain-containing protein [Bacilli bacterium]
MEKKDCLFCKIVKGEIPSNKVYEDDDVLAFLDISQTTIGHTLVVPKEHYDNFLDTPKDIMHKVMDVAQRIGQAQMMVLGAKGVNILSNVNKEAGQTIIHFHVHVIPRYIANEGIQITMKENPKASELSLPQLASEIKKAL